MNKAQFMFVLIISYIGGFFLMIFLCVELFMILIPDDPYGELLPMLYGMSLSVSYPMLSAYTILGMVEEDE